MYLLWHSLRIIWCRMTHTGIETLTSTQPPDENGVTVTRTIYTRCLECGRAR